MITNVSPPPRPPSSRADKEEEEMIFECPPVCMGVGCGCGFVMDLATSACVEVPAHQCGFYTLSGGGIGCGLGLLVSCAIIASRHIDNTRGTTIRTITKQPEPLSPPAGGSTPPTAIQSSPPTNADGTITRQPTSWTEPLPEPPPEKGHYKEEANAPEAHWSLPPTRRQHNTSEDANEPPPTYEEALNMPKP